MQDDVVEWDDDKAALNLRKHGVDFADAICVFADLSMQTVDEQTESGEMRYLSIGMGCNLSLLVVAWTQRGSRVRIISARKASKQERNFYAG